MAPRCRLLDLERDDAFFGAGHSGRVSVAIHAIVVWPILLAAIMLLHLAAPAPFPHAGAAVCAALYGAYFFLPDGCAGALDALICWAASGYEPYPCFDAKDREGKEAKKMA